MVNGLERLEKFFSSRRRDRERSISHRNFSIISSPSQDENGPHFPSPSFISPTSRPMKPREESITYSRGVKERSQSLPDPHGDLMRSSSVDSNSTVTNHKHHPSDPIWPLSASLKYAEDSLHNQQLSQFRFPEDSLFKNNKENKSEKLDASPGSSVAKDTACENPSKEPRVENILDWNLQRTSSLLSTLGLDTPIDTSIDNRLAKFAFADVKVESSTSRPLSTSSDPPSPKTKSSPITITIPPRRSSRKSSETPTYELTLPPRKQSLSLFPKCRPDSPPESDGEETSPVKLNRSPPVPALASPIQFTPRPSFDSNPPNNREFVIHKHPDRESWGTKPKDPVVAHATLEDSPCAPLAQPLRKPGCISSKSTITRYRRAKRNLKEPSLDEFYALNDEDVSESLLTAPNLVTDIPPTPPPKDSPKTPIGRSRSTRHAPIAPTTAINFSSGELTPPCTPTDSQFLSLVHSPANASGVLGATWTANIAKAYNFDLVYVISLWPKGEGNDLDPSLGSIARVAQSKAQGGHAASQCAIVSNSKSGMTGQLLAGYGLHEFGSPFRIHAQFHSKMLGFKGWKEYRDELASPGMISRGWTCSFNSDHIPITQNSPGEPEPAQGCTANRGIVFAAYTRKTTTSNIPVNASPKQTAVLGKLYRDAQTLVDGLVHGV
ncbi:uncharacterized protein GGS25DRAFT_25837 [Hypoxylon fragiforme]|uniref:uncharacterized protein n=1 Tax=Hypoxylon fragiforme TaxID=63214 RepID=UPI0020C6D0DF|nr:uncharacterized protein GGS25DRAFT_25837 [Hypoxylon fragiforme]KAI2613926.1 hypothetical protein GGS25DRAFT_25837 [Hypoxylon fragiforme]